MFLHQSAYLDRNLYRASYAGHVHQMCKIQRREEKYVNTHIRPANFQFGNIELRNCHLFGQVAIRAEVVSAQESDV